MISLANFQQGYPPGDEVLLHNHPSTSSPAMNTFKDVYFKLGMLKCFSSRNAKKIYKSVGKIQGPFPTKVTTK